MKLKTLLTAAIAVLATYSHAGLQSSAFWDANNGGSGLQGVQFNVGTGAGITVGLGAHPYTDGVTMPNNGVDRFYGQAGLHPSPPLGQQRARWSFDFFVDMGQNTCRDCRTILRIDIDPSDGVNFVDLLSPGPAASGANSLNLEMAFLNVALGHDFDPFSPSTTSFELAVRDAAGANLANTSMVVQVPEPGSLALVALGLLGLVSVSRRRKG